MRDEPGPADPDTPASTRARAPFNGYLIVAAGIVAVGLILHLIPLGGPRFIGDLTDSAHVLGFAALAFSLLRGLAVRYEGRPDARRLRTYLLTAGLALAFGMLAEALQIPAHRDASWGDVGRDACGIAAGLLAAYAGRAAAAGRILVLAAMLLILLAGLFGPGRKLAARLSTELRFPVLADFESPLDLTLVELRGATVEAVPAPPGWPLPGHVALVRTRAHASYPGIGFYGLPRNWSAYKTLTFRAAAAQKMPLNLYVLIRDAAHGNRYTDRFNARYALDATPRTIRIPLANVRRAPATRRMDMTRIVLVTFFVVGDAPHAFYLDRIALR